MERRPVKRYRDDGNTALTRPFTRVAKAAPKDTARSWLRIIAARVRNWPGAALTN
jgi:hypothetical protein